VQDIKNFPVEATVLSIPGAAKFTAGKVISPKAEPAPTIAEKAPELVDLGKAPPKRPVSKMKRKIALLEEIQAMQKAPPKAKGPRSMLGITGAWPDGLWSSMVPWDCSSVEAERAEDGSKKVKAENLKLKNQERSQK